MKPDSAAVILRELVTTLPKCSFCEAVATKAHGRGGDRYCDTCGQDVPDYPRAPALRKALRFFQEEDDV